MAKFRTMTDSQSMPEWVEEPVVMAACRPDGAFALAVGDHRIELTEDEAIRTLRTWLRGDGRHEL